MEEKHKGYSNKETYTIALWLQNDETMYNSARDILKDTDLHNNLKDYDDNKAEALEEYVQETMTYKPSLQTDLLNDALARVHWQEVVNALQDEGEASHE